jgi:O-antigen/teichoic acid export membrane protein
MLSRFSNILATGQKAIPIGLGLICMFAGQAVLARLVGVETFGSYGYILTWVTLTATLARAGYEWMLIKALPGHIKQGEAGHIRFLLLETIKAVTVRAGLGLILLCMIGVFAPHLFNDVGWPAIASGALLIVALTWAGIRRAWALAHGATWFADAPENIIKPMFLCIGVAALIRIAGSARVDWILTFNFIITIFSLVVGTKLMLTLKDPAILSVASEPVPMGEHRSLMKSMWLTTLLNIVLRNSDILLVGMLTDVRTTGIYLAASKVATIAGTPVTILDQIAAPRIAQAYEANDHRQLRSITLEYGLLASLGCMVFVGLLVILGPQVVTLTFGKEFAHSFPILLVLIAGHAANSLTGPTGILLSMTGSHRVSLTVAGLSAALYVVLLCILTPLYLAMGAAIASAIALMAKVAFQLIFVVRRLNINPTLFRWPVRQKRL